MTISKDSVLLVHCIQPRCVFLYWTVWTVTLFHYTETVWSDPFLYLDHRTSLNYSLIFPLPGFSPRSFHGCFHLVALTVQRGTFCLVPTKHSLTSHSHKSLASSRGQLTGNNYLAYLVVCFFIEHLIQCIVGLCCFSEFCFKLNQQ